MRKARVLGTRATKSFVIPLCSIHETRMQKNDVGEWVCFTCADGWLRSYVEAKTREKSIGGVALPVGVKDVRRVTPSFRDLMPNRATRRRLGKAR